MWWFLLGAVLGMVQLIVRLYREPMPPEIDSLLVGFLLAAVFGTIIYGTLLWLVFSVIF